MANNIMPEEIIFYVENLIFNINKAKCLLDAVETPLSLLHCHTFCLIGLHHVVKLELHMGNILTSQNKLQGHWKWNYLESSRMFY